MSKRKRKVRGIDKRIREAAKLVFDTPKTEPIKPIEHLWTKVDAPQPEAITFTIRELIEVHDALLSRGARVNVAEQGGPTYPHGEALNAAMGKVDRAMDDWHAAVEKKFTATLTFSYRDGSNEKPYMTKPEDLRL